MNKQMTVNEIKRRKTYTTIGAILAVPVVCGVIEAIVEHNTGLPCSATDYIPTIGLGIGGAVIGYGMAMMPRGPAADQKSNKALGITGLGIGAIAGASIGYGIKEATKYITKACLF